MFVLNSCIHRNVIVKAMSGSSGFLPAQECDTVLYWKNEDIPENPPGFIRNTE